MNALLRSSKSVEWYTPACYLDATRKVLGRIDLDPASCAFANRVVGATTFYSEQDDGLRKPWQGKVFLNPPYARVTGSRQQGTVDLWVKKLVESYVQGRVEEAILFVNSMTYKRWFDPLWNYPLCFVKTRIPFYTEQGTGNRSPHGSAIAYFGMNIEAFYWAFSSFGPIVQRYTFGEEYDAADQN